LPPIADESLTEVGVIDRALPRLPGAPHAPPRHPTRSARRGSRGRRPSGGLRDRRLAHVPDPTPPPPMGFAPGMAAARFVRGRRAQDGEIGACAACWGSFIVTARACAGAIVQFSCPGPAWCSSAKTEAASRKGRISVEQRAQSTATLRVVWQKGNKCHSPSQCSEVKPTRNGTPARREC